MGGRGVREVMKRGRRRDTGQSMSGDSLQDDRGDVVEAT